MVTLGSGSDRYAAFRSFLVGKAMATGAPGRVSQCAAIARIRCRMRPSGWLSMPNSTACRSRPRGLHRPRRGRPEPGPAGMRSSSADHRREDGADAGASRLQGDASTPPAPLPHRHARPRSVPPSPSLPQRNSRPDAPHPHRCRPGPDARHGPAPGRPPAVPSPAPGHGWPGWGPAGPAGAGTASCSPPGAGWRPGPGSHQPT